MWAAYDDQGWYTGQVPADTPSATPVQPPSASTTTAPGELRARWGRYRWTLQPYPAPPPPPAVPDWADADLDRRYHWIDVGPFMDRFGGYAVSIAGSNDPEVRGLVTLLLPRQYVDLKRTDVAQFVGLLVAKELITQARATAVLSPITTEAERHIKGLPQPTGG
jgi:hypothetical protein